MNHDVFISYSSKNNTTAQAICRELEQNGIRCWIAPRDIPMGAKYASVIAQAIKSCRVTVLVFSKMSVLSPWVEKEINLALSNRKVIIPYKIDSTSLEDYDEFYLMLNNVQSIDAYPDSYSHLADLVHVVVDYIGRQPAVNSAPRSIPRPMPSRKMRLIQVCKELKIGIGTAINYLQNQGIDCEMSPNSKLEQTVYDMLKKQFASNVDYKSTVPGTSISWYDIAIKHGVIDPIYKVGDFYDRNGLRGVIFEVDTSGHHGKIVSLQQIVFPWAIELPHQITGASSKTDGMYNLRQIQKIPGWREKYPSFAWCAALGAEWYLPALEELCFLLHDNTVFYSVNPTLVKCGACPLYAKGTNEWYWSSSEAGDGLAFNVYMDRGLNIGYNVMSQRCNIRAVAVF